MSRFADQSAVRKVDLGPCECKDTPHSSDWAEVRTDLSDSELAILFDLPQDQDAAAAAIAPFVPRWNLTGPDGEEWPPSPAALFLLKRDTMKAIGTALAEVMKENANLPNPSGAPSPASPRGSASRTPTPIRSRGT